MNLILWYTPKNKIVLNISTLEMWDIYQPEHEGVRALNYHRSVWSVWWMILPSPPQETRTTMVHLGSRWTTLRVNVTASFNRGRGSMAFFGSGRHEVQVRSIRLDRISLLISCLAQDQCDSVGVVTMMNDGLEVSSCAMVSRTRQLSMVVEDSRMGRKSGRRIISHLTMWFAGHSQVSKLKHIEKINYHIPLC